jgi:ketosteroid isomerase-like protein
MKHILFMLAATILTLSCYADSATNEAKKVFESYVELVQKYDPAIAELYSDDATIRNTQRYPDGTSRTRTVSATTYKQMWRQIMPIAKKLGDTNTYSEVAYKEEDGKVRVTATCYESLKKYSSPLSLLIAKKDGKWLIVEDISESRP